MVEYDLELPWSLLRHHIDRGQLIIQWKNMIGLYWHTGVLKEIEKGLDVKQLQERWDADKACAFEESQPGSYTLFEFAEGFGAMRHPERDVLRRMSNHFLPWRAQCLQLPNMS